MTEFALLARVPDEALHLERLVTSIARIGNPELDPAEVSRELDALAERVGDGAALGGPPDRVAAELARVIGGDLGFRGSPDVYELPQASYIDAVLERRDGLPILLGVVWILLGRRLDLPIAGVNYPGHFLVCLDAPGARLYLDPFRGGAVRDTPELVAQLGTGGAERRFLEPVGPRPIVTRMLTNLKHLFVRRREAEVALGVVDRLLLIGGEIPAEVRDRGILCIHLGRVDEGLRDLRRYLVLTPEANDRPEIEAIIAKRSGI
jgi:regulator of sirC expression with transglutaminase-like and TPR domain